MNGERILVVPRPALVPTLMAGPAGMLLDLVARSIERRSFVPEATAAESIVQ